MLSKKMIHRVFIVFIAVLLMSGTASANPLGAPLGTAFTYQGRLTSTGSPVTGTCDFQFGLWGELANPPQIGPTLTLTGVPVNDGLFTVLLDFGPAFDGNARWLEIAVRCPAGSGTYQLLSPRQALTPTPYAITADTLDGLHAGNFALSSHTHWGETWNGSGTGLTMQGGAVGFSGSGSSLGVIGVSEAGTGVKAQSNHGDPLEAYTGATRKFYVDNLGNAYASGDVPVLPRAQAPQGNSFKTVDSAGTVGYWTSVTIGADGLPLISYGDNTNHTLKVAHCEDILCASATLTTLDSIGGGGPYSSVAIGADGLGLISYANSSGDLKVAHCEDIACTTATISTLASSAGASGTSVTIGRDGLGWISYNGNSSLELQHCSNAACTSATYIHTSTASAGSLTSATVGGDGLLLVAYFNDVSGLGVLHCSDVNCTSYTLHGLDSNGGTYVSVTTGVDGMPLISYFDAINETLKVVHCETFRCLNNTITTVDDSLFVGRYNSVTIGADGLPLISYFSDDDGGVKVAHCANIACTASTALVLATNTGAVGQFSAVTIGADGLPLISYLDQTGWDLKVAHCSNPLCVPYFRRR